MVIKRLAGCIALLTLLLISCPLVAHGEHGQTPQWVNEAVDQNNNPCCGDTDCLPLYYVEVIAREGLLLTIVLDNQITFIHQNAFREVACPSGDHRPFVCFHTLDYNDDESITESSCMIKKDDGTVETTFSISCITCVLKPICSGGNS